MLRFEPLSSHIEPSFWQAFADRKINIYKLDDNDIDISASLIARQGAPSRMLINSSSFDNDGPAVGILKNTNTIEEFKAIEKMDYLNQLGLKIWTSLDSCWDTPNQLLRFGLLAFADLKRYKFLYWCAFPALMPTQAYLQNALHVGAEAGLGCQFDETQYMEFARANPKFASFFLVKSSSNKLVFGKLTEFESFFDDQSNMVFGFADPSTLPENPGWPLRNYLYMIFTRIGVKTIKVLCFRPRQTNNGSSCLVLSVTNPVKLSLEFPKCAGWEMGSGGKAAPRLIDLSSIMDPKSLSATAVDLNLRLMKWRIAPSLNLDSIAQARCLLLGAGTLGCSVARMLLAWGVHKITLVDNGRVSFSNPVRQPLFSFEDCLNGGAPKAKAAAQSLRQIFPKDASGYELSIPMPGHFIVSKEKTMEAINQLEGLISSHDIVFLLTDSRESRWLPTLLSAAMNKLVINAALGFDSFVVMRHGVFGQTKRLGCYFCNDVVAPVDSIHDRTLDQQCTVTRPGLSGIVGGLAVELLASILNHADGIKADQGAEDSILGKTPHQIRGSVNQFSHTLLQGLAYDKCTACSERVLGLYANDKEFLLTALGDPKYLEKVTGLEELHKDVEIDWDE